MTNHHVQEHAVAVMDAARALLTAEDVRRLVAASCGHRQQAVVEAIGLKLDPRFVRGGLAKLVLDRLRGPLTGRLASLVGVLTEPVLEHAREFLGEDADDPSFERINALYAYASAEWGSGVADLMYAWVVVSELRAAPHCAAVLDARRPELMPAPGPGDEGGDDEESQSEVAGDEREVFSALDVLVIRSVVDAFSGTVGALAVADARRLVDELVKLNGTRRTSWFHLGFLDALDDDESPDLPEAAANDERLYWRYAGLLTGAVRRQQLATVNGLDLAEPGLTQKVLLDPILGRGLVAVTLSAVLQLRPARGAQLLEQVRPAYVETAQHIVILRLAHDRARGLLVDGEVGEARAIWQALRQNPPELLAALEIDVRRRLVACARASNDFATARSLLADTSEARTSGLEAVLETERGLVACEIAQLRHVSLDGGTDHRDLLRARLERGRDAFESALSIDVGEWRASLCLGVLETLSERPETAVHHLASAIAGMHQDPRVSRGGLPHETRFNLGIAKLASLEPGDDGAAFGLLTEAVSQGWVPSTARVLEALNLLVLHGSKHADEWLSYAYERLPNPARLAEPVLDLVGNGGPETRQVAQRLARSLKVKQVDRFKLFAALLGRVDDLSGGEVDEILGDLEDFVHQVQHPEVTRMWAAWLNSEVAAQLLGTAAAAVLEADAYRDLGETAAAMAVIERLIHPALSDPGGPYDPRELLELFHRLAPPAEEEQRLRDLVERADRLELQDDRPVKIVFVGGNETQQSYREELDRMLEVKFDNRVSVKWIFPGWGANWKPEAERAESHFAGSDVLVLMPYVRTNLGRRLRRTSGEAGLPWVACTGKGRDSMLRSLLRAASVAQTVKGSTASA